MADANDIDLLREFAEGDSEPAFAELVRRHINMVYSVALRFIGNSGDAEDVAQAVFIILARKAGQLSDCTVLTGWLYETTRFTAMRWLRTQARRHAREQEASMQTISNEPENLWPQMAPHLEAAMSRLHERDRTLLALRFYENKTGAEAAMLLGIREDAARKRMNRALEKLRKFFSKRGVSSTAETIAETISANSIQAAPIALAKSVTIAAIAKGATASASTLILIKGALKIMAWTKMKTAVVVGACVLLAAGTATTITIYNMGKPMRSIQREWSVLSGDDGQWNWTNGVISGQSTNGDSILASTAEYRDVTLSATASTANREASLAIRMQDADNGYIIIYSPDGTPCPWDKGIGHVTLIKRISGNEVTLGSYHAKKFPSAGQAAKITVIAKGPWINVRLNGLPALRVKDTTYASGFIGLRIYGDPNYPCDATFSNLIFY